MSPNSVKANLPETHTTTMTPIFRFQIPGGTRVFEIVGDRITENGKPVHADFFTTIEHLRSYHFTFLNDYCWPEIQPVSRATQKRWLNRYFPQGKSAR